MKYPLYRFLRPILKGFMKLFYRVQIIGKENIPKEGRVILAGNHTSNLDSVLVMSSTKRMIHFLAKIELIQKYGFLFRRLGIIPVDRKRKNQESLNKAKKILAEEKVIGIFPEGTINKGEYYLLPFKYGAVSLAKNTTSPIVPFAIIGEYKFLRRRVKIVFAKPYYIKDTTDLTKENVKLMNKIINLIKENKNEK